MGSKSSKSQNDYASLFINIKEPEHFAGQIVQGQVQILVKKEFPVHSLDLVLKGKQKTYWQKTVKSGKHYLTRMYNGKKDIISQRIPLVTYSGNVLGKGYHKIQFHFNLPQDIPGSFVLYGSHSSQGKVQYQVNVELTAADQDDNLKFKRVLLVSQKLFPRLQNKEMSDERNVKTFCCFSKGLSRINARFEQNSFHVNQTARTLLSIDNTDCRAKITKIKLRLQQKAYLKNKEGGQISMTNIVAEEVFPGIPKQERTPHGEWRFLQLNLYKFVQKYLASKRKYSKEVQKHYGDFFLQPSNKTSLIDCRYFVQILPEYDVIFKSCSGAPKISLPINLGVPQNQQIPSYYPAPQIFSQPYEGTSHEHVAQPINLNYVPDQALRLMDGDVQEPLLGKPN